MNHAQHSHPFFAIDLSRNFEIEPDELRAFVMSMPTWKYVELEGTKMDGTEVDTMFIWFYSDKETPRCTYNIQALADFMDTAGFDISPDDIVVDYNYAEFTCACCNFAPVLPLEEMSRIEGIYSNVDNYQLYIQLALRNANLANKKNK